MASHSVLNGCAEHGIATKEDHFAFLCPPSFDLCGSAWQNELPSRHSYLDVHPLMETFVSADPLYSPLDIEQTPTVIQDDGNELCVWNELDSFFEQPNQMFLLCDSGTTVSTGRELKKERQARKCREDSVNNSISNALTRQTLSKYFYMPITQAAKALNVGLTLLKKRCRELGIRRWPHRKLMSLQTLIKNVQEMKKEGEASEGKLKEAIEILEKERKLLEEMPDMQLENKTKRLRQACFKANYKKRKLMGMIDTCSTSSSGGSSSGHASLHANVAYDMIINEDDEEIKYLLDDPFSHANNLMF